MRLFFACVTYSCLARRRRSSAAANGTYGKVKNKRRYYLRLATNRYRELCRLCEIKGMNAIHKCLIMKAVLKTAEVDSRSGTTRRRSRTRTDNDSLRIESSFDRAIRASINSGHIQDAALACQLAAEYFVTLKVAVTTAATKTTVINKKIEVLVARYLQNARDLYLRWGATAVVQHLEDKYPDILLKDKTTPDAADAAAASASDSGLMMMMMSQQNDDTSDMYFDSSTSGGRRQQYVDLVSTTPSSSSTTSNKYDRDNNNNNNHNYVIDHQRSSCSDDDVDVDVDDDHDDNIRIGILHRRHQNSRRRRRRRRRRGGGGGMNEDESVSVMTDLSL
jgi:hypothetical protein